MPAPFLDRLARAALDQSKWGITYMLGTHGIRSSSLRHSPSGAEYMAKRPDAVAYSIMMELDPSLESTQAVTAACDAAKIVDIGTRYVTVKDDARAGYFVGVRVDQAIDKFDPATATPEFMNAADLGTLMQTDEWLAGKYSVRLSLRVGIKAPMGGGGGFGGFGGGGGGDGASDLWLALATDKDVRSFSQNERFSVMVFREPEDPAAQDKVGEGVAVSGGALEDIEGLLANGAARGSFGGSDVLLLGAAPLDFHAEVGGIEPSSRRGYDNSKNGCTAVFAPRVVVGGMQARVWVDAKGKWDDDAGGGGGGDAKRAKLEGGGAAKTSPAPSAGPSGAGADVAINCALTLGASGVAKQGCDNVAENLYSLYATSVVSIASNAGALFHEKVATEASASRGEKFAKLRDKSVRGFLPLDKEETGDYVFETAAGVAAPTIDGDSGDAAYAYTLPRFKAATEHDGLPVDSMMATVKFEITPKTKVYEVTDTGPEPRQLFGKHANGSFDAHIVGACLGYRVYCKMQMTGKKAVFSDVYPRLQADVLFYRQTGASSGADANGMPISSTSDAPSSFSFAA